MHFAKHGSSWQSIQVRIPAIDVLKPFKELKEAVNQIFEAAKRIFRFFIEHEVLLSIPTQKPKKMSA